MRRGSARIGQALLTSILTLVLAPAAVAHEGGDPFIYVPVDHVEPGESFPVSAADLGANQPVDLEVAGGDQVVLLGSATAGPEGHFETTMLMPESIPTGYVELLARSGDGSVASTWVRVGAPDLRVPAPARSSDGWLVDPSLVVVGVVVVLLLVLREVLQRRPQVRRR